MNDYVGKPLSFGGVKSPYDKNDWTPAALGAPVGSDIKSCTLSRTTELSAFMQSMIGCCVGCSFTKAEQRCQLVETGQQGDPSFRFVYALAKCKDGSAGEGTFPRLVAQIGKQYGIPTQATCPNDVSLSHEDFVYHRNIANIPQAAFDEASKNKTGAYAFPAISEEGIKQAILLAEKNRGGVIGLFQVGDTFWKTPDGRSSWAESDILPLRAPRSITSRHEMMIDGFEYIDGKMIIKGWNSWSPQWGHGGRFWMYVYEWLPFIDEILTFVDIDDNYVSDTFKYKFTKTLAKGSKGADVVALQHALKIEGCFPIDQAFTGNYGDITMAAVSKFQEKYSTEILKPLGLVKGTGIVGAKTIVKLNSLYSL